MQAFEHKDAFTANRSLASDLTINGFLDSLKTPKPTPPPTPERPTIVIEQEAERPAAVENPASLKPPKPAPEPAAEQDNAEMVSIAKDALDQLNTTLAEVMAENEALGKILDADDQAAGVAA